MSLARSASSAATGILCALAIPAFPQTDPGVRGGWNNTAGMLQAILAHQSVAANGYRASEASAVINNFQTLSKQDKQSILDFLRSL
jgi:hypothetical protein